MKRSLTILAVVLAGMAWQTWRVRRSRIPSSISLKASA